MTSAFSVALASIVTFAHAKPVRNALTSRYSWICHLIPIGAVRQDTRAEVFVSGLPARMQSIARR
jgi:hypothetical protein